MNECPEEVRDIDNRFFQEGFDAYLRNVNDRDCPYKIKHRADEWHRGHLEAAWRIENEYSLADSLLD